MNNFGIFKLLTSAFDFYQKTKKNTEEKGQSEQIETNEFLKDILSFSKKQNVKEEEKKVKTKPLQEGMLFTMKSHDDFVKRVMKNNKNQ